MLYMQVRDQLRVEQAARGAAESTIDRLNDFVGRAQRETEDLRAANEGVSSEAVANWRSNLTFRMKCSDMLFGIPRFQ